MDVSADLTTLVLNGLGATTGTATAKAALAAASAGVIGAKGVINTDVFYQKTLPALVAQMQAGRQNVKVRIEAGGAKPVSEYSIDQALSDVSAYYVAGSVPSAISQITQQAAASQNDAIQKVEKIRRESADPQLTATVRLLKWLYPGGNERKKIDATKEAALKKWQKDNADSSHPEIATMKTDDFLHESGDAVELAREKAADALIPQ
ncbi:hypothetical protein [Cupriavidus sp. UYPR2.512]|uniref:hypothetical protein n=1 Tax=Cupriavidus sp. UYPR2.512 TaxID=1080187 RepID=UPI00037564BF|nr:hypothetical protein [Cupriavidus sp. UYPR2.512]UIF89361.1 hypothetical protein KAF44_29080 [Cupriavidus necator]